MASYFNKAFPNLTKLSQDLNCPKYLESHSRTGHSSPAGYKRSPPIGSQAISQWSVRNPKTKEMDTIYCFFLISEVLFQSGYLK